jgi:hypothetical protein
MSNDWIIVADRTYDVNSKIVVREVKCPKCGHCETFTGGIAPDRCFICEEPRNLPEVI